MVLCETPLRPFGGLLGAQEHREEMLICDVGVVKFEAVGYQRSLQRSGDQRLLWNTHLRPLGGL